MQLADGLLEFWGASESEPPNQVNDMALIQCMRMHTTACTLLQALLRVQG